MYNVSATYPSLWPIAGPFYGPFDRRRHPRIQAAAVAEEESFRFEPTWRNDGWPVLEMHWVVMVDVDGRIRLRPEWSHLRQEEFVASN
jgi:hypothetical protein